MPALGKDGSDDTDHFDETPWDLANRAILELGDHEASAAGQVSGFHLDVLSDDRKLLLCLEESDRSTLLTCHQVYNETRKLWYTPAIWHLQSYNTLRVFLKHFRTKIDFSSIRHLRFCHEPHAFPELRSLGLLVSLESLTLKSSNFEVDFPYISFEDEAAHWSDMPVWGVESDQKLLACFEAALFTNRAFAAVKETQNPKRDFTLSQVCTTKWGGRLVRFGLYGGTSSEVQPASIIVSKKTLTNAIQRA